MKDAIRGRLASNLARVEERITAACRRAGRERSSVQLIAVTKTVAIEVAALFPELGILDLAESRPQELWKKAEAIPAARWHLIGHMQRNKVERTVPLVHAIHSVDSYRLLSALEAHGQPVRAYLEVNCSGEAAKGGFPPSEAPALAKAIAGLAHVRVVGLMTMAALEDNPERCRPTFQMLRRVRDQISESYPMTELSMGMSNDFEVAIEEGATAIRLGSVLLEGCHD
jgi:pyridoxal phosphate enzyme (YggS family)